MVGGSTPWLTRTRRHPKGHRSRDHGGVPTYLNLWKQHLGHVPEYVFGLTELETLILADNDLTELPEGIGRLTRLRTLDLGHNALAMLPESIGALVELSDFLYLHDNQFTSLPASIANLKRLRYLNQ